MLRTNKIKVVVLGFLFSIILHAGNFPINFYSFGCPNEANAVFSRDGSIVLAPHFIDNVSFFANHSIELKIGSFAVDSENAWFTMSKLDETGRTITEPVKLGSVVAVPATPNPYMSSPTCIKFKDDMIVKEFKNVGGICPQVNPNAGFMPPTMYVMNCVQKKFAYLKVTLGEYWAFSGPNGTCLGNAAN